MQTIPYFIQVVQSKKSQYNNIHTTTGSCTKDDLEDVFVEYIVDIMKNTITNANDLGYDTKSWTSRTVVYGYRDFCDLYCIIHNIIIDDPEWGYIVKCFYFDNDVWVEWDVYEEANTIYNCYLNKI